MLRRMATKWVHFRLARLLSVCPLLSALPALQVANTRELQRAAWKAVADAEGLPFPAMERPQLYDMRPERAAMDVSGCGAYDICALAEKLLVGLRLHDMRPERAAMDVSGCGPCGATLRAR